jgi:hypothetical protein
MEVVIFILACFGILWHPCIDLVLKSIYNLCPSLHIKNHMGSWIYKLLLCNVLYFFALDEHKHFPIFPICLALLSTHVVIQSSFWNTFTSFGQIDGTASIDCRLIHLCLTLVGADWKVEHEGVEECRDWNNIRRCNMR